MSNTISNVKTERMVDGRGWMGDGWMKDGWMDGWIAFKDTRCGMVNMCNCK